MAYVQGDTVWLKASFYDRTGALQNLTSVQLKIYDSGRTQMGTTISGVSITNVSTGVYEYAYVLPAGYNQIIYEYSGLDSDGKTQLGRYSIDNIWASPVSGVEPTYTWYASQVTVADSGDKFTGTNVETVLAELEARIYALEHPTP